MKKFSMVLIGILLVGSMAWILSPEPSKYVFSNKDIEELSPNQPPSNDHIRFQKTFFKQKNSCGKSQESLLKSYNLIFKLPLNLFDKNLRFLVTETVSGNQQEIIYTKNSFIYPKLYNGLDYTELKTPVKCKKMDPCPFQLRPRTEQWKLLSEESQFTLQVFDADKPETLILEKKYEKEPNLLFKDNSEYETWPEFSVAYKNDQKKIEVLLSKKPVMDSLLKSKELYIVTQTKEKIDQVEFDQTEYDINLNGIEKRFEGENIVFRSAKKEPEYLGATYYILDKNFAVEYTLQTINKGDPFFSCAN